MVTDFVASTAVVACDGLGGFAVVAIDMSAVAGCVGSLLVAGAVAGNVFVSAVVGLSQAGGGMVMLVMVTEVKVVVVAVAVVAVADVAVSVLVHVRVIVTVVDVSHPSESA